MGLNELARLILKTDPDADSLDKHYAKRCQLRPTDLRRMAVNLQTRQTLSRSSKVLLAVATIEIIIALLSDHRLGWSVGAGLTLILSGWSCLATYGYSIRPLETFLAAYQAAEAGPFASIKLAEHFDRADWLVREAELWLKNNFESARDFDRGWSVFNGLGLMTDQTVFAGRKRIEKMVKEAQHTA